MRAGSPPVQSAPPVGIDQHGDTNDEPRPPAGARPGGPRVVAVVSDAIYPYHMGGKEVRYHQVVRGLAGRGLEVHVFSMHWWDGPPTKVGAGIHYHALCRVYPLHKGGRRSMLEAVMFALACLRLLAYRFDLVDADHMPHLQLFTVQVVAWLRRVPLVDDEATLEVFAAASARRERDHG